MNRRQKKKKGLLSVDKRNELKEKKVVKEVKEKEAPVEEVKEKEAPVEEVVEEVKEEKEVKEKDK